ncbi:uncharacterized protein LOC110249496 isoform X2 [Exaiptasia diaphana]|uniref:Uncharacterized protein n=1 Tax=Exaiptasia diaphana TaxID=2652724 RepID=A0A913XY38_EXADI|nr:uncharacterized protein LOC110249496 isoform X2 [Exaiptasia diaphana]KXJ23984.1 RING finger protein 219 [Exaiptasia diaphana]
MKAGMSLAMGSIDLQVNSDSVTKAELRRTRLELIRKEYEDDLAALHNTIERLKVENKRLHERLSEQDKTISALHLSINHQGKDGGGSKPPTPDLDMLLKLTSKLQEASVTYEQLKADMQKTSQDNKRLQDENDNLVREVGRLKDESSFAKSPQRFSHYSMAAMQTKISQYEKEIQQLKKALTRSDGYIDELNARIEGRTPDGRERASSSAESCPKQTSTIDGSRRSSSVSLEGVNANSSSPQQLADNGEDNEDSIADYDRPTMVNVTSFQPVSSSLTGTTSQTTANTDDILAAPLADAASAIEAADHWLKAASSKTESATGITPPDVFYPGSDLASHRLDAKLGIGSTGGVERFPASRQLMLLSERISRQRETTTKLDCVQGAPSPSSSDGGKVPLPKTLDFSDMMGETGSMNGDSPRLTPRLDRLSPNISYDASNSLSAMASCAYTKIKSECQDPSDPTLQAKRVKLEKEESSGFQ